MRRRSKTSDERERGRSTASVKQRAEAKRLARAKVRACDKAIIDAKIKRRRTRLRKDIKKWLKYYLNDALCDPFSEDHVNACDELQDVIWGGGKHAEAMPRGSGKTTIGKGAILYAILEGFRKYVVGIAATDPDSIAIIDFVKTALWHNQRIKHDYPQLASFVEAIDGKAARANVVLSPECKPVGMKWAANKIILPTYGKPGEYKWSGAAVEVCGITGSVRGKTENAMDGSIARPDFVFLDDPQTRESAQSAMQTENRMKIIKGDVMKLAGPKVAIAAYCACTVIAEGDLADQLVDRNQNPEWRGNRVAMLKKFPDALETLWAEYAQHRALWFRECKTPTEARKRCNTFYRKNRRKMDRGSVVYWKHRIAEGDVSALHTAMNEYFSDKRTFFAEFQNDPAGANESKNRYLTAEEVRKKINNLSRCEIPLDADHLVCHIDVGKRYLHWAVCAFREDFMGWVVDYGVYPDGPTQTLETIYPKMGLEGRIRNGLDDLEEIICGRNWEREDESPMPIERLLVDSSWGQSTSSVYSYALESAQRSIVFPAHGIYVGPGKPFNPKRTRGRRLGDHWYIGRPPDGSRRVRLLSFDSNHWKSFFQRRMQTPKGEPGCISLFGSDKEAHKELAEHATAERMTTAFTEKEGEYEIWRAIPNRPNHWLDNLAGCCVAASMVGCSIDKKIKRKKALNQHDSKPEPKKKKRKTVSLRGSGKGFASNW